METLSKQTHPLILVAAASLSIASLAAAAHYTGLIPARVATPDEAPIALAASTAAPSPAPIPAAGAVATLPAAPTDSAKASAAQHGAAPRPATRTRAEHRVPVAHEATREERSDDWGGSTRRVAHDDAGIDVIPAPVDYTVTQEGLNRLNSPDVPSLLVNLLPNASSLSLTTNAMKEYSGLFVYRLQGWL